MKKQRKNMEREWFWKAQKQNQQNVSEKRPTEELKYEVRVFRTVGAHQQVWQIAYLEGFVHGMVDYQNARAAPTPWRNPEGGRMNVKNHAQWESLATPSVSVDVVMIVLPSS